MFSGYPRSHSITAVLLEIKLPSLKDVMHNISQWKSSNNIRRCNIMYVDGNLQIRIIMFVNRIKRDVQGWKWKNEVPSLSLSFLLFLSLPFVTISCPGGPHPSVVKSIMLTTSRFSSLSSVKCNSAGELKSL